MTFDVISLARIWITYHVIIVITLALIWITIKARCNMGKLVYFDGVVAVCDFEESEQDSREKAVKLLLEADIYTPHIEKHVKPLLECGEMFGGSPLGIPWGLDDGEWANIEDSADRKTLSDLGYTMNERSISPRDFDEFPPLRTLLYVPRAVNRICELSRCVQFLAKLFLLANGDEGMASQLPNVECERHSMKLVAELPGALRYSLNQHRSMPLGEGVLSAPAKFDMTAVKDAPFRPTFRVPVEILYQHVLRSPYNSEESGYRLPESGFELKRIAASAMLVSLLNCQAQRPFILTPDTLSLTRSESGTLLDALADAMIAGKIRACPHCGRPILVKRDKGMMYCSASCRTLYNRKAKEMCSDGASVDAVHASFPAIPKETIRGWLPMEGR